MIRISHGHRSLAPVVLSLAAGLLGASPANAQFAYNNFSSVAGLGMVGSSLRSGNNIVLSPAQAASAGALWYIADKQNVAGGFDTTFTFRVQDVNGLGADGFAFVIQNTAANAIGGVGGALGYADNFVFDGMTPRGIANSLAVEIDLWNNFRDWADLSDNHVSIQSRGTQRNSADQSASLGAANIPNNVSDGALHTARIAYVPGVMSVFIDNVQLVTASVNLGTLLNLDAGRAWVGITAASGGPNFQSHSVESWTMQTTIPAPGAGLAVLGGLGLMAGRRRR